MIRNLSLIDRVSLFFLALLAAVLVCYSAALYVMLRHQLRQQFDDQLQAAFQTLVAAVEVEADDVKFEPSDHMIDLKTESGLEDARWVIVDERGLLVDHSQNLERGRIADDRLLDYAVRLRAPDGHATEASGWRVLQQRLSASAPKPIADRDLLEREALVITVARSPIDLNTNLRLLGLAVTIIPIGVGVIAAVAGRRVCRRALQPIREMAKQARMMVTADADRRLPVPNAQDELTDLGDAFNEVLNRLFESLERQRRFTGDAAHQLRTPLTSVLGQLEVALRRPRSTEEYCETLASVRTEAERLHCIIESLLFLARSEREAAIPDSVVLSLRPWIRTYVENWSRHPRNADLKITDDLPMTYDASIPASPILLQQLLDNLVENALKYSPPGTAVEISMRCCDQDVEIAVCDQGPGVADEDRSRIFQPFFRSTRARQAGIAGTGLGLAVAARIAAALGGRLEYDGERRRGSCFALVLPLTSGDKRSSVRESTTVS